MKKQYLFPPNFPSHHFSEAPALLIRLSQLPLHLDGLQTTTVLFSSTHAHIHVYALTNSQSECAPMHGE